MPETESKFYFVGGQLSLDFINTQVGAKDAAVDFLSSFTDLIAWLQQAGTLDAAQAKTVLAAWGQRPEAKALLDQTRKLRSVLREMAQRLAVGKSVGPSMIEEINRVLARESGYHQLVRDAHSYELRFQASREEAAHLLIPIAMSAAELLCMSEPQRIRQCGNPVCAMYYYDTSKNHTRRWCSMAVCGNRMKAAAFYQRNQKNKKTPSPSERGRG